jgi:cell wall-associated NlpC family hydrolase
MVRLRLVAPLLAGVLVVAAVPLGGAGADPISDKRDQAAKIADQIDTLNAQGEALAERYNATNQQLSDLQAQFATTKQKIAANDAALTAAKIQMHAWALRAYIHAGSGDALLTVLAGPPASELNAASLRQGYSELAVRKDQRAADEFTRRKSAATALAAQLSSERDAQSVLQRQLVADKIKVEQSIADQNALLTQMQGELAQLVAEEQARRAAEQERLVKERLAAEAAARKAAADAAARKAAADAAARKAAAEAAARTSTTARPTTTAKKSTTTVGGPKAGTSSTASGPTTTSSSSTTTTDPNVPKNIPTPPATSAKAALAIKAAMSQLGVPYVFGGGSPTTGFDCSGLTSWAWAQVGVDLPHNAAAQFALLAKVPIDQLQPGDLVFFGRDLHHVGLYIGDGQMVHAPYGGRTVTIASIYRRDLVSVGGRPG